MRRRPSVRPDPDDDEGDDLLADPSEEDDPRTPASPRRGRTVRERAGDPDPLRSWDPGVKGPPKQPSSADEEEEPVERGWFGRPKRPVYWRARDALWFEPLVALAIIVVLLVGLYAYTQNWPPVYVVESESMQHGSNDVLGLINTGDLVLAEKVDPSSVTTYMVGLQTGYSTYGEYGDVLLYHPSDDTGVSPIIHRAIVFLVWNGDGTWSAPELAPLACTATSHPYYSVSSNPIGCGATRFTGTLTLYHIGWQSVTVPIPLGGLGPYSGFVTMGDNNYLPGNPGTGEPDQTSGISVGLVQPGWILGVARGMIPWFGAIKLLLEGQASMVPVQSWQLMGITLAAVLLAALGLHLALRRHDEGEEEGDEVPTPGAERPGLLRRLLHRSGGDEDGSDEPAPATDRIHRGRTVKKSKLLRNVKGRGGRPRPSVRRSSREGDDADDGL